MRNGTIQGRRDRDYTPITFTYDDKGIYHDGDPLSVAGVTHEHVILMRGNGGVVGSITTADYWHAKRGDEANATVAGALLAYIAYRKEYEDAIEDRLLEGTNTISIDPPKYCGYVEGCENQTSEAITTGLTRRDGAYVLVPICEQHNKERLKKYNDSLQSRKVQRA